MINETEIKIVLKNLGLIAKKEKDVAKKKIKSTFCLDINSDDKLNAVYTKRRISREKTSRSALVCEGIQLLFNKEQAK